MYLRCIHAGANVANIAPIHRTSSGFRTEIVVIEPVEHKSCCQADQYYEQGEEHRGSGTTCQKQSLKEASK